MSAAVNIHEAKTHLSRLVDRVVNGETIIIAKAGRPVAKLVAVDAPAVRAPRRIGCMRGQFVVPDDFDSMGADEIAATFEAEA